MHNFSITKQVKNYILLHITLVFYSINGVLSKMAAGEPFLSTKFCILYGAVIFNLGLYAILWQQILKRISLSKAFINKSITVVWGMIWGVLIFNEKITLQMLIGSAVIFLGVYLVVTDNE